MASRCASIALVTALTALGVCGQAPSESPQLRGSGSAKPGQMLFRVGNNASFPITLGNCEANLTVPGLKEVTLAYNSTASMVEASFFWVVPEGTTWDCTTGCLGCFFVSFGLERGGGLVTRLGYETTDGAIDWQRGGPWGDSDGPLANTTNRSDAGATDARAITGVELVVAQTDIGTRESSVCGETFCAPDWERDHAVSWNSTIDLIIQGSAESAQKIRDQPPSMLRFGRWFHPHVFHPHVYHPWRRPYGWHPRVWRRPLWRRPIYAYGYCWRCSRFCLRWCR